VSRTPNISVAICTRNRCGLLAKTLDRLAQAERPISGAWDILVVNNACTDNTRALVASFLDRLPLRETYEPRVGLSHARNRALGETKGSHIAFIDDDVLVGEGWLTAQLDLAKRHPEASVFAGPVQPYFPVLPDPDVMKAFPFLRKGFCEVVHEQSEGLLPDDLMPAGANMAFRRSAIDGLRFNTRLGLTDGFLGGHEDHEFLRCVFARGDPAIWSPQLQVQHYVDVGRMNVRYLAKNERDRARTRVRSSKRASGLKLFSVPLPVLAGYVVAKTVYSFWSLTPFRRPKLAWMARSERFTGKVQEYQTKGGDRKDDVIEAT